MRAKKLAADIKADPKSEAAKNALNELIHILNSDWRFARCQACYALDAIGPLAAPAIPDLLRAANCGDPFVEQDSVRAIASIGPEAAPALELLTQIVELAVSESNAGLRSLYAVQGLGNMGEPALKTIPLLERASQSKNERLSFEAQKSLDKLKQLQNAQEQTEAAPAEHL